MNSPSFFSTDNIHRFCWGLAGALVLALVQRGYSHYRGPGKIIVATPQDGAEPLVVRMERTDNSSEVELQQYIRSLVQELKFFRTIKSQAGVSAIASTTTPNFYETPFNLVQIPAFDLPDSVDGYTHKSLSGIADVICPPPEIDRQDAITIEMTFYSGKKLSEFSPIVVRMLRDGKDPKSEILELKQQFELTGGLNRLRVQTDIPIGRHDLYVGVYAKSELGLKYPPYYNMRCPLTVR